MISLQQNLEVLQPSFANFHSHGGLRALTEYQNALSITNEVSGIQYRSCGNKHYIVPTFIEGQDSTALLELIAGNYYVNIRNSVVASRPGVSFGIRNYWCKDDLSYLQELSLLDDPELIVDSAWLIAKSMLSRTPETMAMVCGPISQISPSMWSKEQNLNVFHRTMLKIAMEEKIEVFNQLPFETAFAKVEVLLHSTHRHLLYDGSSSGFFITHFYRKVIATNKRWKPFFIHHWHRSTGATLENKYFLDKLREPVYLRENYHLE
jgi:hypothetical protein